MFTKTLIAAGLLGLASAQSYTPPKSNTFGALYTPEGTHPVVTGENFQVTWDPTGHTTDGSTISLVLCRGNSNNCVNAPTAIVSGVPAKNAQYSWAVPCGLTPGQASTETGYGMLIIVDGTGDFQYSTQFSVVAGASCGSSSNSTSTTTTKAGNPFSFTSTTSTWGTWMAIKNTTTPSYSTTYVKPTTTVATVVQVTNTQAPVTLTPTASATPSQFKGAATKVSGSAAALIMAAGAAFFAL